MNLSSFLSDTVKLAVPFGPETLNLVYRPGVYTPEFESKTREAAKSDDADFLSETLSGLLNSWDLLDDAGAPVPTDKTSLRAVPIKILSTCVNAVVEDMFPNRKASAGTASTS